MAATVFKQATNLYFDKDIQDCSIAECAAIAGIAQNPSRYTPLIFPEYNKERRETVLFEMYDQEKLQRKNMTMQWRNPPI